MRGFFVTGTDTGVGKTVVSAALLCRYPELRYWKPIQTGIEIDDDTAEVVRLSGCRVYREGIRLPGQVSPHLAAQRAGIAIDLRRLAESLPDGDWVVEGAGGVLVPVNDTETMADLMKLLGLPVVVAARTSLGTINHTLLTLEALRSRSLEVAGVILVGELNRDNRDAIQLRGQVVILGELPRFDHLTREGLAAWVKRQRPFPPGPSGRGA
jgi:dethiobiotin synthase